MIKFVPYVRTIEGYIERQSYAVFNSPESNPLPYVYEEELAGWPETKVFWASKTGPSVGLAPLANSSERPNGITNKGDQQGLKGQAGRENRNGFEGRRTF